jgi:hypothetical protein
MPIELCQRLLDIAGDVDFEAGQDRRDLGGYHQLVLDQRRSNPASPGDRSTSMARLGNAWRRRRDDDRVTAALLRLDRIASNLVGLRMPRALEALDHTVQQIEKGKLSALEAIDQLLAEELTVRESRRIGVAMNTARLTPARHPNPRNSTGFDLFRNIYQSIVINRCFLS